MRYLRYLMNGLQITVAYAYRLLRGRAISVPKTCERVLIVQTAKLGDMVCSTPVMHAVRAAFPHARITVLGDALNREVLAGNTDVDEYLVSTDDFFTLLRAMRQAKFDASIVLVPDSRALALSFLSGTRLVVAPEVVDGYCPWQTMTYRLLRRLCVSVPHHMGQYAPREYLHLLEPLGVIADDTKKHLNYSDAARKNADAFLRAHDLIEKNFVIIAPSAGNKIKNWPADRFARVAEYLVTKGLAVIVIGGPRDREEVSAMMRAVAVPKSIIDAGEQFSIDELKALIAQAALFVSTDTGPLYIAEAFDVPTIDILGPMDEREQPPRGEKHRVVIAPRGAPAIHIMNARVYDAREARRQVEAITVEMVIEAINQILL